MNRHSFEKLLPAGRLEGHGGGFVYGKPGARLGYRTALEETTRQASTEVRAWLLTLVDLV